MKEKIIKIFDSKIDFAYRMMNSFEYGSDQKEYWKNRLKVLKECKKIVKRTNEV